MWALALGLHETVIQGYEPANLTEEIRLNFSASLWSNVLNLTFDSLTGQVAFMEIFRVSREVQLIEYTNDSYEFRGLYVNLPYELSELSDLSEVELINKTAFRFWKYRSDGIEDHYSSFITFTFISLLSIFVAIYITMYIAIISYGVYKQYPPARHSEPAMSISF
ncbi:hypothetical protein LOD99_12335 [Oopsacas minuta]|uniref:Uncharacterized protein n=1 Tax=Oopsacas minuta TaxID=111878 RepID=A0AAV7JEV5_9METZ|nr:hypothetical protein LOD99_12335 [Oopsacas minuta]